MPGAKWNQLNRRDHMRRHGVTSVTDDREVIAMLARTQRPNPLIPKSELRRQAADAMAEWAKRQGHNKPEDPPGVSTHTKPKP